MPGMLRSAIIVACAWESIYAFSAPAEMACATADDCSLLGNCVNGACVCLPGWTGVSCGAASLAPLDPSQGYQNSSAASWGARPVWDSSTSRWHLYLTEIANQCPLALYQYNSQIARAVSVGPDAGGPYIKVATAFETFHHNPYLIGPTPDGMYLLFFIGAADIGNSVDCSQGVPSVTLPRSVASENYITMAWTKDVVRGPWQQRIVLRDNTPDANQSSWHCHETNPAASVLPNGTVVLIYRSQSCLYHDWTEHIGVAIAPHWSAEFVRDEAQLISPETSNNANNEDPFLWSQRDPHSDEVSWHMLMHQQGAGNVCNPDNQIPGGACGAHWFAHDPRGPWRMSREPAYTGNVTLTNGTNTQYQMRQRPMIVFQPDGQTPHYLFNGASFDGNNLDNGFLSHTFAQKFTTSPP